MSTYTSGDGFLRSGGENGAGEGIDLDPSLDAVVEALSDHRRRGALYVLSESDGDVTFVVDIAQKLALMEGSEADIDAIRTELHHAHLPKLERKGIVEFDQSAGTVRYTGDERVEQFLAETMAHEREE